MFLYSLVCSAYGDDPQILLSGMNLVEELAHKNKIPITWVVSNQSSQGARNLISRCHVSDGDDAIMTIDLPSLIESLKPKKESEAQIQAIAEKDDSTSSSAQGSSSFLEAVRAKAEEVVAMREKFPKAIQAERGRLQKSLPWAKLEVAAASEKNSPLVSSLESLGFRGIWGYRWQPNQPGEPSDIGCPWGLFFVSKDNYKAPDRSGSKILAIEESSLDFNATFHAKSSAPFSCNPLLAQKFGIFQSSGVEYWTKILESYMENERWNKLVPFIQHINPQSLKELDIENVDLLDRFFHYVATRREIQLLPLPKLVDLYASNFDAAQKAFMLCEHILPNNLELQIPDELKSPCPKLLLYRDSECQLVFQDKNITPIEIRNYISPQSESANFLEYSPPSLSSFHPYREREKLILKFDLDSTKIMPYGLAFWGEHSHLKLVSSNVSDVLWVGENLLFVKLNLTSGLNQFEVVLSI